jgi:hypothetical protein
MSNDPVGLRPRSADLRSQLRLVALGAVAAGVALLAAAAFVLSYEGIHQIALQAGVSPRLAKLYPLIFDVMLVIAAAAALSLRGASWWARCYAWASLLILLTAMAVGNAVHATGTTLPAQPTKIAVAIIPWVLLLMAFGLLLEMLRHFRRTRSAAAKAAVASAVSGSAGAVANGGPQAVVTGPASEGKGRGQSQVDLDTLLGPRAGEPPAIDVLYSIGTGQHDGHQVDPVSYGEDTGYVHPDSYLDEGEYSPHGDTGGPGSPAGQAGDGTHLAGNGTAPAEAPAMSAEAAAAAPETPATAAPALADPADTPATSAEATAGPAETAAPPPEPTATPAETAAPPPEATATPAEATAIPPEPTATPADTAAPPTETPADTPATSAEATATPAETPATATSAPATPAEATADPAETTATAPSAPATPAEATADPAEATATPAPAEVGEMAPASENSQAAGAGQAAAETPAVTAKADQGGDGVAPEAASAEGPALERMRSTPTRPE